MRASCVATVSKQREHISSMNMVVQAHLYASIFQVRIRHVPIWADLQNHMVSSDVIECDGGQNTWCIVGYSVHHSRDFSIRHGEDRFAPAPPVLISRCTI